MKKRLLALLLTAALILTWLPATAKAATTLQVGGSGSYAMDEAGLNAAISAASDGDTIRFVSSGTITLTANIMINKSITLDLNGQTIDFATGDFNRVILPQVPPVSVTIQGPGNISTYNDIFVYIGSTLTVQGDAVIEGTKNSPTVTNYGTLLMTDGTLRQKNGQYVLLNSGTATFDNVKIETSNGSGSVIWANNGTLTLNNCTTINNFSGPMTGTLPSVILVSNSAAVTLNRGSVTAPAGSTLPAILVYKNATLTNNGAAISGGYVIKFSDLSVSVSSGAGKVTLAQQTAEPGVTYYYKTTAADDTAGKPSYDTDFNPAGWTAFSAATDIATASTATVYVQVVKVGDGTHRIYGWGQGSAVPTAAPTPTPTPAPEPTSTPTASPIVHNASIYVNGRTTLTAPVSGGTWQYDSKYIKLTDNGNGTVALKGLKAGTTTVTYTAGDVTETFTVTIKASKLPATGQDFVWVWALAIAAAAVFGCTCLMLRKKRNHA